MTDTVNPQITDAVTQTNATVLGESPAQSMGMIYQSMAHSMSLLMQNSVASQGGMQQLNTAIVASSCRQLMTQRPTIIMPQQLPINDPTPGTTPDDSKLKDAKEEAEKEALRAAQADDAAAKANKKAQDHVVQARSISSQDLSGEAKVSEEAYKAAAAAKSASRNSKNASDYADIASGTTDVNTALKLASKAKDSANKAESDRNDAEQAEQAAQGFLKQLQKL